MDNKALIKYMVKLLDLRHNMYDELIKDYTGKEKKKLSETLDAIYAFTDKFAINREDLSFLSDISSQYRQHLSQEMLEYKLLIAEYIKKNPSFAEIDRAQISNSLHLFKEENYCPALFKVFDEYLIYEIETLLSPIISSCDNFVACNEIQDNRSPVSMEDILKSYADYTHQCIIKYFLLTAGNIPQWDFSEEIDNKQFWTNPQNITINYSSNESLCSELSYMTAVQPLPYRDGKPPKKYDYNILTTNDNAPVILYDKDFKGFFDSHNAFLRAEWNYYMLCIKSYIQKNIPDIIKWNFVGYFEGFDKTSFSMCFLSSKSAYNRNILISSNKNCFAFYLTTYIIQTLNSSGEMSYYSFSLCDALTDRVYNKPYIYDFEYILRESIAASLSEHIISSKNTFYQSETVSFNDVVVELAKRGIKANVSGNKLSIA